MVKQLMWCIIFKLAKHTQFQFLGNSLHEEYFSKQWEMNEIVMDINNKLLFKQFEYNNRKTDYL